MKYDYLSKIRGMIRFTTKRKTINILEGRFSSVFRGRSLEFEDLKEYDFGDNVHDIDWKSSSRTGKTLIRRYVAEKKHNVLLAADTRPSMLGDTPAGESKQDLAAMICGTVAYLAGREGADFSMAWCGEKGSVWNYFRSGEAHLERMLYEYRKTPPGASSLTLSELLQRSLDTIRKRMIIFIVTDLAGLAELDEKLIRRMADRHDVYIFRIRDASLFQKDAFDLGRGRYENRFFSRFPFLRRLEEANKKALLEAKEAALKKYRVRIVSIEKETEILDRLEELLRRSAERV